MQGGESDGVQDRLRLAFDATIVEPQDSEPLRAEPGVAIAVMQIADMSGAVGLDDKARTKTDEIDDVAADGYLTAELHSLQAAIAQTRPQGPFVGHGLAPHGLGEVGQSAGSAHRPMIAY